MLDETDIKILECLLADARMPHKEIGEHVHLTGQAVGFRIRKLEDAGVIQGVHVSLNHEKLGLTVMAHIIVFMKMTSSHAQFQSFVREHPHVKEAYRISGDGCYSLRLLVASHGELNEFLDRLLDYANYRVHICLDRIK
ncbi:Lrp/AsnC family transcriptional regulator [Paenibacillus sp. OAS669]|uniref:Lrp/AsnC family transcriptional regulator n=1 Tax=Paenibacillus sp. OAS669 TaxID=2663821 RepID=UPI0019DD91AC|nr:Lrp/AsnC family transcriptional regulator [Paenibacillus sp. OAS669]MBE1443576.1 Lrp/AsnC family leucine-responsive transcriptional regulator [Paenibacillus sp. OAS669]